MYTLLIQTSLFAYIFSLYFFSYRPGTNIISNAIAVLLMVCILMKQVCRRYRRGGSFGTRLLDTRVPWLACFLYFIATAGLSYFVALDSSLSLKMIKTLTSIFILIFILSLYIDKNYKIDKIITYIIYSGFLASLYILLNFKQAGSIRLGAVLGNQNNMAMIVGSSLVFAGYRILFEKRYIYLLYSLFMSVFVVLSGSRRAIIFVVVSMAMMVFLKYKHDYKKLLKIGAAGIASLILFYVLITGVPALYKIIGIRFQHVFDFIAGRPITYEFSIPKRVYMFNLGMEMFKKRPILGYGVNNYRVLLYEAKGWQTYSHNNFIEIVVGTGILGAIGYYGMFAVVLWKLRKAKTPYQCLFLSWLTASLAVEGIAVQYYSKLFHIIFLLSASAGAQSFDNFDVAKRTALLVTKIAIITETLAKGGAEKTAANISLYLSDKYEKSLIVYDGSQTVYPYDGQIIDLKSYPSHRLTAKLLTLLKRICKVNDIKEQNRFHAVISLMDSCNIVNLLTKQGEKVIVSARNDLLRKEGTMDKRLRLYLLKWLCRYADIVVAVSEGIGNELVKKYHMDKRKIKVIYNGYDLRAIKTSAEQPLEPQYNELFTVPCIITVGRLTEQKGQKHLIRAFKKVKSVIHDVKLILLGQGELETELKQLTAALGLADDVYFMGFQENPYRFIRHADVFVLSSLYEGFPNALAEAMACGVPVISTDCYTGPREILAPETDTGIQAQTIEYAPYGILVPVCKGEKEEELLAQAIINILSNPSQRGHYAQMASKRIQDFSMEKMIHQWEEVIQ